MRWADHIARIEALRNAYNILVGKPEWKRPLGKPRRRWEDNTRIDLMKIGWDVMDWILLVQDRNRWWATVNTVINIQDS
jgi:hypothetical protein